MSVQNAAAVASAAAADGDDHYDHYEWYQKINHEYVISCKPYHKLHMYPFSPSTAVPGICDVFSVKFLQISRLQRAG